MRGFRAFSRGENLWSKSEKQMQIDLLQFTYSRNPSLLADAANHLAVLEGDRTSRQQLDSGNPNYQIVTQGFLQGGNAREDVPSAIRAYRLFGHTRAMFRALKAWRDTDAGVDELAGFLSELSAPTPVEHSADWSTNIRTRLLHIDEELAKQQTTFSETMNFESSRAESILLISNVAGSVVLMYAAGLVSRRLTRRLRRSELKDLALQKANDRLEKSAQLRAAELEREIQERKQVEAELLWKTAFLEAQGNATVDGILVVDRNGEQIFRNEQFLRLWDIPQQIADDMNDASLLQYVLGLTKNPDKFLEKVLFLYEHPELSSRDEIELKDGTVLDRYSAPVLGKDGQHFGRIWAFRDVTERRRNEDALHESEERFRLVVEDVPLGILIQSGGIYQYLNPAALAMFGAETAKQIVGHPVAERIHPEDLADVRERIRILKEEGGTVPVMEEQLIHLDGTVFDAEVTAKPFIFEGQEGSIVFVRDITRHKREELALRESEERFRRVVEGAPVGMYIQTDGVFRYLNPAALSMFGAESVDQIVGQPILERVHPDHRAAVIELAGLVKQERKQAPLLEEKHLRLDGSAFDTENTAIPIFFEGRDGAVVFFSDITERKQAERALRSSEEMFRQFAENIREVFWVVPLTADEEPYVSPAYEQIWERPCESVLQNQLAWMEGVHPDDLEKSRIRFAAQLAGENHDSEYRIRTPAGQEKWIRDRAFPIRDRTGQLIRVVGIAEDITEQKRREAELALTNRALSQAQKMEAVGRLAGGVAHDFNNLLMVIQTYTEMLQERLPIQDSLRRNTEQILKAAERGAGLTGQMLAFSRKQIISPVVLDLNAAVNDTAKMLKRLIGEDIDFRVNAAGLLWAIEADPDQIAQVLMNLCVNSRDAMPQGGTLTVTTENVTFEEGGSGRHVDIPAGDYVRLAVADTGMGISEESLEQIFEPFFTTKEVGKGTGLGLAMVYGIVKQSGGYVWVDSELGKGTCFTICLPRVQQAVVSHKNAATDAPPRGTESLLVVEDEEFIREGICEFLRSLGYTVFAASSGEEALLISSEQEHIDLLITDVVMPKMSGRELSQMLGSLRPDLKTIHMSGYTDDAVLRHGIHDLSSTFLQKPFGLGMLARKVRNILGRAKPGQ
jgi:PAS domain S-box-containing protein